MVCAKIDEPVNQANEYRSADHIAHGNGNQIVDEKARTIDFRIQIRASTELDQHTSGDEVHICNAVFHARGDERSDRKDNCQHFITHASCTHAKPNREADKNVATDARGDSLKPIQTALRRCDAQHRVAYGAGVPFRAAGEVREQRRANGSDEVSDVNDRPIANDLGGRDSTTRPGHYDQVVSGKEFCSGDNNEDQAEAEGDSPEEFRNTERQCDFATSDDGGEEDAAPGNECPSQNSQHEGGDSVEVRLLFSHVLGLSGHLRRKKCVGRQVLGFLGEQHWALVRTWRLVIGGADDCSYFGRPAAC